MGLTIRRFYGAVTSSDRRSNLKVGDVMDRTFIHWQKFEVSEPVRIITLGGDLCLTIILKPFHLT